MNALIWLKGVTAGLELEDLEELDIPLIGGVRDLYSVKFSEGLRLEEGTWGGDAAEPIDPRPKAVSLSSWVEPREPIFRLSWESESGSCLIPAPNGCKGWTLIWFSFALDSAAARASSRASFCWRRILSTTSKKFDQVSIPMRGKCNDSKCTVVSPAFQSTEIGWKDCHEQ